MILIKFIGWVFIVILGLVMVFRIFGPFLMKLLMRFILKRAQKDMHRQQQDYDEMVDGHSPFEDSVYVDGNTKVSIKRGQPESNSKATLDNSFIEEVDFEDVE